MVEINTESANDIQAEVLMALENMQTEKTSLLSKVKILGLSFLAFIAVGFLIVTLLKISTIYLLILVIMLFIHEAGHYIGMWKFGYKNIKMFFIPLFGAAVNGYACVSVTKESIIYLLGPIPGILIGFVLGGFYFFTHDNIWFEAARIFITINTINLLPLFPLDGGQFLFGILPQKTYKIQWIFQVVLTILIFFILFFHFKNYIWGGLLGLICGGSQRLYRNNKIASKLLASGIIVSKMPEDVIPSEIASEIIALVEEETQLSKPRQIAEITWAIWTRIKAKRPTLPEQICLALTYVSVLALGVGLSVIFFL